MKMLAVDTTTDICGVALADEGLVVGELSLNRRETHTRSIMPAIQALLSAFGMKPCEVDLFAVTRGPGSFTGLRIGISTVKGLAVACDRPMIGVSSLDVLSRQAEGSTPLVCAMMDARRNEVYWRLYRRDGRNLMPQASECVGKAMRLTADVNDICLFIGNGALQYREKIESTLHGLARFADEDRCVIRPSFVARHAWQRYLDGGIDQADTFTPVYLRKSDAELGKAKMGLFVDRTP